MAHLGKYFLLRPSPVIEPSVYMQTLFLRNITVLDFAYLSDTHGWRGESLHVHVELAGELDAQGFILDFGPAKKILKALVDETLDHALAVPALHPALKGTPDGFAFLGLGYEAPAAAVRMLEGEKITLALLTSFLETEARERLPANVKSVRFTLEEEGRFGSEPNFRYTHGLRLHEGNCQRLLHGHRNPIEVWIEGARSRPWEEFLATEWEDAHFTYSPTLKTKIDLPLGLRQKNLPGLAVVEYSSPQGFFRASLPASRIILLDTEPSIENIARLGAERVRQAGEKKAIKVVAYEGLNKGASFTLS